MNASVTATYNGATYQPGQFVGTTPTYEDAESWTVAQGSFFTANDVTSHNRVVVLGQTVVANLFGAQDPLGQTIKLNGANFRVVGVLRAKGSNGFQDQDDVVILPYTSGQVRLFHQSYVQDIYVQVANADQMTQVQDEISTLLRTRHRIGHIAGRRFDHDDCRREGHR